MTLISVHNSGGCVGRCDAKCYNATCADCDCVCGGKNHGAGLKQAQDNTREYIEEMIQDYKIEKSLPDATFEINKELKQLNLF